MWRRAAQVHFWILYRGGRPIPHPSKPSLNHSSGAHAVTIEKGLVQGGGHSCGDGVSLALYTLTASPILHSRVLLRFFDFRGIPTRTFVRNVGTCLHGTVAGSCQKNVYRLTLSDRRDRRDGTGYGAIPTDATAAPAAAGASASACSSCIRTVRDHRVREPVLWLRVRQRGPWRAEPLHFASHTTAFRGPATAHIEQYSMRWLYIIINTHTGPTLLSRWHAHLDETRIHARRSLQGQGSCASVVPRLCLS